LPVEQPTNRVLAALAHLERQPWQSRLERVEMRPGHTLVPSHAATDFVYFPEDALVGLAHPGGPDGGLVPLALVGNDGLIGVAPFLGVPAERIRAVVLHPGSVWRLPVAALDNGALLSEGQLRVVLRYVEALNAQMAQVALCQLQHTVYQRLCRWLLDAFGRTPGFVLHMDATELSAWVGAAPEAVALATTQLVAEGALSQRNGSIHLLDSPLLGRLSCTCHHQVQRQVDRLFPR
jgi:CRP-like cAMP-binding protein